MLQRMQSLYLSLTTIFAMLLFKGDFVKIIDKTGIGFVIRFNGIYQFDGVSDPILMHRLLPLSALTIIIPVMSVAAIFMYKKRKLQMTVVMIIMILAAATAGLITYYSATTAVRTDAAFIPLAKFYLIPPIVIFALLAYRGIRRDENLVSSYHRLR
ncbi:MAG TPA: DUF4293 domain-containing protein [Bacteroidales bacterium]|nr:DUF4293 family protein [Bacteroidales bacterium]HNR42762.1 DUF4293 domain-containing protein [Bacteroidales bacterium]